MNGYRENNYMEKPTFLWILHFLFFVGIFNAIYYLQSPWSHVLELTSAYKEVFNWPENYTVFMSYVIFRITPILKIFIGLFNIGLFIHKNIYRKLIIIVLFIEILSMLLPVFATGFFDKISLIGCLIPIAMIFYLNLPGVVSYFE